MSASTLEFLGAHVVASDGTGSIADLLRAQAIAMQSYAADITANPARWLPYVETFTTALRAIEAALQKMHANIQKLGTAAANLPADDPRRVEVMNWAERYAKLKVAYDEIAAPFYQHVRPAQPGETVPAAQAVQGQALGAPVVPVVIVGGVVIGIGAISWAYVSYQKAQTMQRQIEFQGRELEARVEAMQSGRTLPPSTVPPPDSGGGWWDWMGTGPEKIMIGAGLLGALAIGLAELNRRYRR